MSSRSSHASPLGVQGSLVHLHFHPTKKKTISDSNQSSSRDKISHNKQVKPSRIPRPVHFCKKQNSLSNADNGGAAVVIRMPSCGPINPWSEQTAVLPDCPVSSSSPRTRTKTSHTHQILAQTVLLSSPKIVRLENAVIQKEERLKKLRYRYLARKYGSVWIIKTFGRVSPAKARAHYEQQLMMTMFIIWLDQWWSAHHEWKLNIRADCHDRYRLWQKVWKGWLEYIRIRMAKRKKWKLAEQFGNERLSRQVFTKWQDYVLIRKNKELLNARAILYHSKQLLRVSWRQWSTVLGASRLHNHTQHIAVTHYSQALQLKTFLIWRSRFMEALVNKNKAQKATKHYFTALCKKCVHSWTVYVDMRRCKANKRVIANELRCRALLCYFLSLWRSRTDQSRSLRQFEHQIEARSCRARKMRSLAAWRHFVRLRHDHYQLMNTATDHYNNVLKHKMLHVLSVHVQFQEHKRELADAADKFNQVKLMGKVWSVWLQRSEHTEEMRLLPLTRKARLLFRNVTLRNALRRWRMVVECSREKKLKYKRADLHFKQIMLPKCFMAIRQYTEHQKHQKVLQERAECFRRETLSSMVFYHWWSTCQLSQDLRLMERIAVLHHEDMLKKTVLTQWRSASHIKLQQSMLEHLASGHHRYNVLNRAYTLWNQLWQERMLRRHQQQVAIVHNAISLLKVSWAAWLKYVMKRRADHTLRNTAEHHFSCTVLSKCIAAWKVHHQKQVIKKRKIRDAEMLHYQHLRRHLLHRWSSNAAALKRDATSMMAADQHWKSVITRKVFVSWWERSSMKKEKAVAVETLVDKAVQLLRKSKQRRLLLLWRDRADEYARHQLKLQLADRHHTRRVLRQSLTAWLSHYRITLKVTLLQRQGIWFGHMRLISLFYGRWRVQLMNVLVERQKTANALWYWSISLQRKTFLSWRDYAIDKKRKKSRYAAAMDWHRQYLVRIGVQQWIEVASSMKALRIERNLRQQAQTTERVWQHVRKCANHWRNLTRRRRKERSDRNLLAHACSKPSIQRVAVSHTGPGWERIAQQLKLSSPHQRPAPRMPTFLNHPATTSELNPLPPPFPISPPRSFYQSSFSDCSSLCSSSPGKNIQNKPSIFQPTSGGMTNSRLSSSDNHETLLPPSAFGIPTCTKGPVYHQPIPLDLSDPATQQEILQARDSLREVVHLKRQQRVLSEQLSSSNMHQDQSMLQHQLEEVIAQLDHHEPVVRGTVSRLKHTPHH